MPYYGLSNKSAVFSQMFDLNHLCKNDRKIIP